MVTIPNRISMKLFGPWLRADNNDSLLFINIPEEDDRRLAMESEQWKTRELAQITRGKHIDYEDGEESIREVRHRDTEAEFGTIKRM